MAAATTPSADKGMPDWLKYSLLGVSAIPALAGGIGSLSSKRKPGQPGVPEGYEMLQFPTRGGKAADIYSSLGGDVYQRLLSMAKGDQGMFQQLEAPALAQFQQQIAPAIAQRYAGSGIGASSGMQNAIAGAGANLAQGLQAQRAGLMQQSMQDVLNLGNMLLARPDVENVYQKQSPGFWNQMLGIGLPILGAAGGAFLGGPTGAAVGGKIGSSIGQSFLS